MEDNTGVGPPSISTTSTTSTTAISTTTPLQIQNIELADLDLDLHFPCTPSFLIVNLSTSVNMDDVHTSHVSDDITHVRYIEMVDLAYDDISPEDVII